MSHGAKVVTVGGKGSLYPLHCIGRSILGHAKVVMSISNMKKAIEDEGLFEVGLSYVGGVTYILTFRDKVTAISGMELHSDFFNSVFSKFHLWNGKDIPYSRLVSLNITGVPFIIRDNSLFDNIGGMFGDVVQKSSFSWQEEDNSLGSVKIITSQPSRIDEVVVIKWNNKSIVCWVLESVGQWFPDIYEVSMQGPQDSESESCSESDAASEDLDDFEEGEIRVNDVRRQDDDRKNDRLESDPMGNDQSLDNRESMGFQGAPLVNAGGNFDSLHGELFEEVLLGGNNEVQDGDLEFSNKICSGGPNMDNMEINNSGPNVGLTKDSPATVANMGKRNRDDRSPPSVGSTQGPTHRLFHQSNRSTIDPIDLNTPVRETSGNTDNGNSDPKINSGSSATPLAELVVSANPQAESMVQEVNTGDGVGDAPNMSDPQRMVAEEV
ncbi:hypothetical protein HanIR_Chr16g0840931 [Helianthus annuus]|nr:hypothetical protein HanIR_Chr16g0840931 [Helianthus annuus]